MSRRTFSRSAVRWLPPFLWMAAIFFFSNQPSLPSAPDAMVDTLIKKTLHAIAYGILAWLWWRALRVSTAGADEASSPAPKTRLVLPITLLLITVLYAASDEWHQTFVPGRMGRISDVLIDSAGAIIALSVLYAQLRRADSG